MKGFLGGASGKECAGPCQRRRRERCRFDTWVWKVPWRRKAQSTLVFLPGKFYAQRSLSGYRQQSHKESDTDWATNTHRDQISGFFFFNSLYIALANPAELMLKALGILQKESHPGGALCQGMKGPATCFLPRMVSLGLRDFPGSHSQLSLLALSASFTCQLLWVQPQILNKCWQNAFH